MQRKNIPEAENRLLILYAMDRLGPATDVQLLQFMTEYDLMSYFTLQLALAEMEEQGQIAKTTHPLGDLWCVAAGGAYVLGSFEHRIPVSRRELIDSHTDAWRERFALEQQTPIEAVQAAVGSRMARLWLMENNAPLMEITLAQPAGETLMSLQAKWQAAAQRIYRAVTLTLFSGREGESLPRCALLEKCGSQDWRLTLQSEGATLALYLPDETLARRCAAAWQEQQQPLCAQLLAAVTGSGSTTGTP